MSPARRILSLIPSSWGVSFTPTLEIKRTFDAVTRDQALWNGVEHFILCMVGGIVTWSDFYIGSNWRSAHVFERFRNAQEHVLNLRVDVNE